ncbi:DUF5133 domain-containing protein [Streptomyces sp. NBC_01190]|uniref:DUF5133 domain-containing protein n=1 Tax=Streptomyces sp. NBC_01190 TaxID=2903767 RepID=UPI0038641DDE|nr:DUF5133 domain-containing protein [Streptomyces sp. NBC_01190]
MLMAHPTVLRTLVERYETLRALADLRSVDTEDRSDDMVDTVGAVGPHALAGRHQGAVADGPSVLEQLRDTIYTLCVSTGTREIGPALAAAREHISRAAFTATGATEERMAA